MFLLRFSVVASACALGVLCLTAESCRNDASNATAADSADADTTVAESDSTDRQNPPPPPAPGTARVRAEIRSCNSDAEPVRCRVRVAEVLGYGSATPPLGTGEHTVRLASALLKNRTLKGLEALGPKTYVLRHAGPQPEIGDASESETQPKWTIQSIE